MQRIEGVDSVQVSLKEGKTTLELRLGNRVTLAQLRTAIKNNGFVSKEVQVVARGSVRSEGFEVSGSAERLSSVAAPAELAGSRWQFTVPAPR